MKTNNEKKLIEKTKSLFETLDFDLESIQVELDSGYTLEYDEFDINSKEFIDFSEQDIAQNDKRGLVNALSNAKRAIDCQVDTVLGCFGLAITRRNFPQKMDLLREMGVVAPRIVNKVVKARNYLEHEYREPELEQVEDALDIAMLFVASLDRVLHYFPSQYSIGTVSGKEINEYGRLEMDKFLFVRFLEDESKYILAGYIIDDQAKSSGKRARQVGEVVFSPKDKIYLKLIGLSTKIEKKTEREREAISLIKNILGS